MPRCGSDLPARRPLNDFCKYACRGRFRALEATTDRTGLIRPKNTKQNKALQRLKRQSVGALTFAKINSVTIRIDTTGKKGVGWLMGVAWPGAVRQRWIARVGNPGSELLMLEDAKRAAVALLRERGKGEPFDWITKLSQIAANEIDGAILQRERRAWPVTLMEGNQRKPRMEVEPELRDEILNTELAMKPDDRPEPLQGGDYPLEHYADGYPKLPNCLRRMAKPERFSDAAPQRAA